MLIPFFLILLAISVIVQLGFASYVLRRRKTPGALPFALLLFANVFYSVGYGFELLAPDLTTKIIWDNLQFTAWDLGVAAYFIFALEYSRQTLFTRRLLPLLFGLPLINALMVWSDPLHGLVRSSIQLTPFNEIALLTYAYEPWFYVYLLYSYLFGLTAICLMIIALLRAPRFYKLQVGAVLIGMLAPFVTGTLTTSGLVPIAGLNRLDITPIAYMVAAPIWAWALFRRRMLDLAPIARDRLVEYMPNGLLVVDEQRRVVDSNPGALALLGDGVISSSAEQVLPVLATLLTDRVAGTTVEHQSAGATGVGVLRLEVSTTPLRDRRKRPVGWMVLLRDRTEHWQMEQALRTSEARYRALVESIGESIFQLDRNGYYIFVNEAGSTVLGYADPDAVIGKHLRDVLDQAAAEQATRLLQTLVETGRPVRKEMQLRVHDLISNHAISAVPIFDSTGRVQSAIGVAHDITERTRMETMLREARDAADAANQAKSTFLARMSHELRTPLHTTLGFAQILDRDPDTRPQHREYVRSIARSGEHLLTLINDILDMAKIEAGHITLHMQPVELYTLVDDVTAMFQLRAAQRAVALQCVYDPCAPCLVHADAGKLRQVLINLLSNAIKFTDTGSITLRLNDRGLASRDAAPGENEDTSVRLLEFAVQDTGIGIDPAYLQRIFEPFSQAPAGSREQEGTGLGLAISRQFVQLMGGNLTVESTVGGGSTFSFTVPVEVIDDAHCGDTSAETEIMIVPAAGHLALTPADVAQLPLEVMVDLYQTTLTGDPTQMADVIAQVDGHNRQLALALQALADTFDYAAMRALLLPVLPDP